MKAANEIRQLVRRINRLWTGGQTDGLTELFHRDVVFVAPGFERRTVGRDACVQSYRDFLASAVLHHFEAGDAEVDVAGETAVAVCPYSVIYEMDGRGWRSSGRDVLVFARDDSGWAVVWRTLLSGPEQEVPLPDRTPPAAGDGE